MTGTGQVGVRRVVCAVDCGTIINPDTVTAQVESGIVFGIGGALWGEITLKNGRVEQSNFHDYRVLRMNETPPIEVHLVRNRRPGGMGEPGTAATALRRWRTRCSRRRGNGFANCRFRRRSPGNEQVVSE